MMRRGAESHERRALWLRGLWPDRNPLRRASDRAEATVVAAALVIFLIGGPLLALAAGHWAGAAALRVERAQQASWRQVPAVLLANAGSASGVGYGGVSSTEVKARWTAPDGQVRTGGVSAVPGARVGSTVRIWVDSTGEQTGPPLRQDQATGQAFLATVTAPLVLGAILLCAASLTIQALDRRRLALWDADWQATEPRWSSRR
ncbi:MAG: hypothetical protein ACHP9Z_10000 [Streptosporangiales bacterium]